jgi:two-component system sensor kinase FixL
MIEDSNETTGLYDSLIQEVAEHKKAEEKLSELLSLLRATLEATADGILVIDTEGKVVSHNQKFLQLWHIPESLAEERDDDKLLAFVLDQLSDPEGFLSEVKRLYSHPEESSNDTLKFKDGRVFERFSKPQKIDERIIGRVWSFRDVTEREISEIKKAELIKEAASINRELEDFAYIVSHDLKAPLRGIKTLVDWIITDYEDKLDAEGKEQLNLLSNRVDRMHNLINGILQYSRIGRTKEERVMVDLNKHVPEIIDILVPPENITITVENKLPTIECEQTRILQVFQNLLSNAIKYMDKPNGLIKVGCIEENGFWKFSITDNGPGIEEKHYQKIFQIFQTLSARDDFESSGVGLTLVKKIIEQYGGKIWIESKVGQGSTFFFTLPMQSERVQNEQLQTNPVN